MKSLIDIHVVLATSADMDVWEEQAEEAADRFNDILHMLYNRAPEETPTNTLEAQIQHIWETWRDDQHLLEIEPEDLSDWVDQLLASWDDASFIDQD